MVRNRAIVKNCPKCQTRVAVATKSCKCGYSFFNARRSDRVRGGSGEASSSLEADVDERRRTSRVRREKPNYYDSQQFEKKTKKKEKKVKRKVSSPEHSAEAVSAVKSSTSKESAAVRAQRRRIRKEEENGGNDMCAKLTPERQELANLILSEINRKMTSVVWTP